MQFHEDCAASTHDEPACQRTCSSACEENFAEPFSFRSQAKFHFKLFKRYLSTCQKSGIICALHNSDLSEDSATSDETSQHDHDLSVETRNHITLQRKTSFSQCGGLRVVRNNAHSTMASSPGPYRKPRQLHRHEAIDTTERKRRARLCVTCTEAGGIRTGRGSGRVAVTSCCAKWLWYESVKLPAESTQLMSLGILVRLPDTGTMAKKPHVFA